MTTQIRPFVAPAPATLAAAPNVGGGSFAAAPYFWKITFLAAGGETYASNEATCSVALNGTASLTWAAPPSGMSAAPRAVLVYRGTASNGEDHLIATLPGTAASYTDTGTAGSVQSPPATAFASITRDNMNRVSKSSTGLSALAAGSFINALRAISSWNDASGVGSAADFSQVVANASGIMLQEI